MESSQHIVGVLYVQPLAYSRQDLCRVLGMQSMHFLLPTWNVAGTLYAEFLTHCRLLLQVPAHRRHSSNIALSAPSRLALGGPLAHTNTSTGSHHFAFIPSLLRTPDSSHFPLRSSLAPHLKVSFNIPLRMVRTAHSQSEGGADLHSQFLPPTPLCGPRSLSAHPSLAPHASRCPLLIGCFIPGLSPVQPLSRVQLFVTPWTVGRQASLSITTSQTQIKVISTQTGFSAPVPGRHVSTQALGCVEVGVELLPGCVPFLPIPSTHPASHSLAPLPLSISASQLTITASSFILRIHPAPHSTTGCWS